MRDVAIQHGLLGKIQDELAMCSRLMAEKNLDREEYLDRSINLVSQAMTLRRGLIERLAVMFNVKVMNGIVCIE